MQQSTRTISEYIAAAPPAVRPRLRAVRALLRRVMPHAVEGCKYGMPTYMIQGKNVIHFAAMKNHLGLYPTPGAIVAFQTELAAYTTSKGAIQFPYSQPLPLKLIERIAAYRAAEVLGGARH